MRFLLPSLCLLLGCYAEHGGGMSEMRLGVAGLFTNPEPYTAAPDGALRAANNAVVERPGMLEPRPGFQKYSDWSTILPKRIFPWTDSAGNASAVVVGSSKTAWLSDITKVIKNESGSDLTWTQYRERTAAARKNLYLNTSDGIRVVTQREDVVASMAGIDSVPLVSAVTTSSTSWLANGYYCAYRATLERTDANGMIIISPSTGQFIVKNDTGVSNSCGVTVILPSSAAAGDVMKLWRTRTTNVVPANEYYLQSAYRLTATDITNKAVTFADGTADADLGAALYTNDSREGIEGANFRPPMAREVATFRGSLFAANTTGPLRYTLTWDEGGDKTGSATGIGYRKINSTRTNGSATVAVASTTGLKVGMLVSGPAASGWTTLPARITAIVGLNLTISSNWTGATDGAPVSLTYYDSVKVGSEYFAAPDARGLIVSINTGLPGTNAASSTYYAYAVGVYAQWNLAGTITNTNSVSVVIEEIARGGSAAYVHATHGSEYRPALPEPTAADDSNCITAADTFPDAIYYSKQDEPEHFPLPYYDRVGSASAKIIRIVPTRDALWIFKEDGLWRLSGVSAPAWRIDPFDLTVRLIGPEAVTVLADVIFAFTTKGVLAITDGGTPRIDTPIADRLSQFQQGAINSPSSVTYAVFMASNPLRNNVYLGFIDVANGETSDRANVYVFNTITEAWSGPWDTGSVAGLTHAAFYGGIMLGAVYSSGHIVSERTLFDTAASGGGFLINADYEYSVTVSSASTNPDGTAAIVINAGSGWTPAVGDAVRQSAQLYIVTATTNATHFTVHAAGLSAAAGTAYSSYAVTAQWKPVSSPFTVSRFTESQLAFDSSVGIDNFSIVFTTDKTTGATINKAMPAGYIQPNVTDTRPQNVRVIVDRAAQRGASVSPELTVQQAGAIFRLSGIGISYEEISGRLNR